MQCTVNTTAGPVLGTVYSGVFQFHGIPYAKAPVGPLRFQLPQPPEPWTEPYDATVRGPIAPQGASDLDIPMGPTPGLRSEDCLTLAISTPSPDANLPVAVWFHGGAHCYGGGDVPWYDGASLARVGQIVVVNLNFRLGPLGFLWYPGVNEHNLPLEDQLAALRWIQENIRQFGGDPTRVTVFGQSAGANDIAHLLGRDDARGLFQQVILESASLGRGNHTREDAFAIGEAVLRNLQVDLSKPDTLLQQVQSKTADEILDAADRIPQELRAKHQGMLFKPVMDQWHTPEQTAAAAAKGAVDLGVRVVLGFSKNEMLAFLPDRDEETLTLAQQLQQLRYDGPGRAFALAAAEGGCPVWKYQFDWKAPESRFAACHCLELVFLFGNLDAWDAPMLQGAGRRDMETLQQTLQALWSVFFRMETPDTAIWPPYSRQSPMVKHFDNISDPLLTDAV